MITDIPIPLTHISSLDGLKPSNIAFFDYSFLSRVVSHLTCSFCLSLIDDDEHGCLFVAASISFMSSLYWIFANLGHLKTRYRASSGLHPKPFASKAISAGDLGLRPH